MKSLIKRKFTFASACLVTLSCYSSVNAEIFTHKQSNGATLITNKIFQNSSANLQQVYKKTGITKITQPRGVLEQVASKKAINNTGNITSKIAQPRGALEQVASNNTRNTNSKTSKTSISATVLGNTLTIRSCNHNAGAICSLKWRGKEFIDDYDHGRQLQSASSFDGLGEDFNPIEAGGSIFHYGPNPSDGKSVLLDRRVTGNTLETYSQMAFWNPVNGVRTSNHTLNKRVTIGYDGLDNVIEYLTQFNIPSNENHTYGVFEAVTAYLPTAFSTFWTYNHKTKNIAALKPSSYEDITEQNLPVIASTADQRFALGVYSPDSPQPNYPTVGYGGFLLDGSPKWNNVFRISKPKGSLHFRSYVVVGTLEDVKRSMQLLHNKF